MTVWNALTDNPLPIGATHQLILWSDNDAHEALSDFRYAIAYQNPGVAFWASDTTPSWMQYLRAYQGVGRATRPLFHMSAQ
jgi:hypothetical protein